MRRLSGVALVGLAMLLGAWLIQVAFADTAAPDQASGAPVVAEVLAGVRSFFKKTAGADGSFRPGVDPCYDGMSDSAYSDLAPVAYAVILHKTFGWTLPEEAQTRAFLLSRQGQDGAFFNVRGTADAKSAQARAYNTTQGLVVLRALGARARYDPRPIFGAVLQEDYKNLPPYMTSFFPLAYWPMARRFPRRPIGRFVRSWCRRMTATLTITLPPRFTRCTITGS
jgi:hypothetical protein